MQVVFNIPGPLREFTQNRSSVRVDVKDGANLREALLVLFAACPGLRDRVLTESTEIRGHVNIFVANEDIRAWREILFSAVITKRRATGLE